MFFQYFWFFFQYFIVGFTIFFVFSISSKPYWKKSKQILKTYCRTHSFFNILEITMLRRCLIAARRTNREQKNFHGSAFAVKVFMFRQSCRNGVKESYSARYVSSESYGFIPTNINSAWHDAIRCPHQINTRRILNGMTGLGVRGLWV